MEDGQTLKLLQGIPRSWLEDGQRIVIDDMASYFGPVSLRVMSKSDAGVIEAEVSCDSDRRPASVEIRLPHPQGQLRAVSTDCGVYIGDRETVKIDNFEGHAKIQLHF